MPRKHKALSNLLLMALALLLAACSATPTPAPPSPLPSPQPSLPVVAATGTADLAPTRTPIPPIATASPSDDIGHQRPDATQSTLLATAVPATPTPAASATVLFPVDLSQESFATPTAVASPQNPAANYRLKQWTEPEAFALIDKLEQYARGADVCQAAGCYRSDLQQAEQPIRLVLLDTINRFPQSDKLEQLQWRLAVANAILDRSDTDQWLLEQVASGLTKGEVTTDTVNGLLGPHGFTAEDPITATNLYGDGRVAWIYQIRTQNMNTADGLLVAVSQDAGGIFQARLIHSLWAFNTGEEWISAVGDHNHNGLSEILAYVGYHSGSMCDGRLMIFEWQRDHFAELTGGKIEMPNDCQPDWDYDAVDASGAEPLHVNVNALPAHHDVYAWNGSAYALQTRTYTEISRETYPSILDLGDYGDRIALIQAVSNTVSDQDQYTGPSYPDFLKFQLGFAYALQSQPLAAQTVLRAVVNSPTNTLTRTVSTAAQSFLQQYHGDADVYRACQAAQLTMDRARPSGSTDDLAVWGFDSSYGENFSLCTPQDAFPLLISTLNSQQLDANPATLLRQAGVQIRSATTADLDGDGRPDWLLWVDSPGSIFAPQRVDFWALLNAPSSVQARYLGWVYPGSNEALITDEQVINVPGGAGPIILIRVGSHLFSFAAHGSGPSEQFEQTLNIWNIQRYLVSSTGQTVDLQLSVAPSTYDQDIRPRFRLDSQAQTWQQIDWPAELIFTDQQPARATSPLSEMVGILAVVRAENDDTISHDLYLLASAYELSGDQANAVSTFWRLWQNYPDSGYARIAESKLEPKS